MDRPMEQTLKITRPFQYHQLDPDVGGYLSVHLGSGHNLIILTTPISTTSREEHRKILKSKIKKISTIL